MLVKFIFNIGAVVLLAPVAQAAENPCPKISDTVLQIKRAVYTSADASGRTQACQVMLKDYSWWQSQSEWTEKKVSHWFTCGGIFDEMHAGDFVKGKIRYKHEIKLCGSILGCKHTCSAIFSYAGKISNTERPQ
jgi:hypothetical protein